MARGHTLESVLRSVRLEAKRPADPLMNAGEKERLVHMVNRVQRALYLEHFWPFLTETMAFPLYAGQRFYDLPDVYDPDRLERLYYFEENRYLPLKRGISIQHYNQYDSFADERSDPPHRWDVVSNGGAEQVEIWPIPQTDNYRLIIRGLRRLKSVVADDDIVDLDSDLIALNCATELLTPSNKDEARVLATRAQSRLDRLKAAAEISSDPVVIASGSKDVSRRDRPLDIRYAPRGRRA